MSTDLHAFALLTMMRGDPPRLRTVRAPIVAVLDYEGSQFPRVGIVQLPVALRGSS